MERISQPVKWKRTLRWIRRAFPTKKRTVVRSLSDKAMGKDCGELVEERGVWVIRVNKQQSMSLRIDTLLHEYAHALSLGVLKGEEYEEPHSPEWGVAYARVYRAFLEWNFGRGPEEDE